jgi:hypothetical protein
VSVRSTSPLLGAPAAGENDEQSYATEKANILISVAQMRGLYSSIEVTRDVPVAPGLPPTYDEAIKYNDEDKSPLNHAYDPSEYPRDTQKPLSDEKSLGLNLSNDNAGSSSTKKDNTQ